MNHALLRLYRNLNERQLEILKSDFAESPKTLALVNFLNTQSGDFKTLRAVHYVYAEELSDVELDVLTNRYYKLRQSLRDWLLKQLAVVETWQTPEEQQWFFLRAMISRNEFGYVLPQLRELEQHCLDLCLYELLINIRQGILHCIQSLRYQISEEEMLQAEAAYAEAMVWAATLNELNLAYRLAFRDSQIESCLSNIKRLTRKHPSQVRFKMIYHYAHFLRGAFVPEKAQKMPQVLIRHLNEYRKLRAKYPKMPLFAHGLQHLEKNEYDLLLMQAILALYRGQKREALNYVIDRERLRNAWPGLQPSRSESEYNNLMVIYLEAEAYEECLMTLDELRDFIEQQGSEPSQQLLLYASYLRVYCFAYVKPKLRCEEPDLFLKRIDSLLHTMDKKSPNYGYLLGARFDFVWQYKGLNAEEVKRLTQNPYARASYEMQGLKDHVLTQFFEALLDKQPKKAAKILEEENASRNLVSTLLPHRRWLQRMLK